MSTILEELTLTIESPTEVRVESVEDIVEVQGELGVVNISGGAGQNFQYEQDTASTVWTIVHTLAFRPNVHVVDSTGATIMPEVDYVNSTTIRITHSKAETGFAYLS